MLWVPSAKGIFSLMFRGSGIEGAFKISRRGHGLEGKGMIGNLVFYNKVFIKMCRDNRYNYTDPEATNN